MSAAVRFRLPSSCSNASSGMFLRASAIGGVELGVGQFDLQRPGLREEQVLDDEVVEQRQLRRGRFLLGRRRSGLGVAPKAFSTSARVISRPFTTAHASADTGGAAGLDWHAPATTGSASRKKSGRRRRMEVSTAFVIPLL